jgi:hypothetical protein
MLLQHACQDRDKWTRLVFLEPSAELCVVPGPLTAYQELRWEKDLVYWFGGLI